jgi:hypothetical protein
MLRGLLAREFLKRRTGKAKQRTCGRQGASSRPNRTVDDRYRREIRRAVTPALPRDSKSGRGDWIRTSDPLRPRQVRYQAALRPVPTDLPL